MAIADPAKDEFDNHQQLKKIVIQVDLETKVSWWSRFLAWFLRRQRSSKAWISGRWKALKRWIGAKQDAFWSWFLRLPLVIWLETKFPGWELGVAAAIFLASCALIFNVVFLIVAASLRKPGPNGLGTLLEQECTKVDWGNKIAHGFINVISTLLITQSNFCMQLLASPTRHDVDLAHRKRQWVDIGMPSFRNIWKRHISVSRMICWVVLALSSAPLHLLWNSVILFSPSAYEYNSITVTEGFARGLPFDDSELVILHDSDEGETSHWPDNIHFLQQDLPHYNKLSSHDCKRDYAQHFIRDRADVVVVVEPRETETNSSTILGSAAAGWGLWPYKWLCPVESSHNFECYKELFQSDGDWFFPNYKNPKVEYCLSRPMRQQCKLEYGFYITIFVIVANFFKLVCFIETYRMLKRAARATEGSNGKENKRFMPLITTGDAIASFLETPDPATLGMSIVEKEDFHNGIWDLRWQKIHPMEWRDRGHCAWFRAIGLRRWLTDFIVLSIIPLVPGIFLLVKLSWLRDDLQLNPAAIRLLGMGNPSGLFLFGVWAGDGQPDVPSLANNQLTPWDILRNVALANTPQLAMTIAYYIWNSHLTVMIAAREYDVYAAPTERAEVKDGVKTKQSLRVTYPQEKTDQRASHFLTIPLNYWVWNTILWTALHWFASQAVFFARVDLLDHWLEIAPFSISQVGYSVLGIICFFALAAVVLFFAVGISVRRLENRMPLAATCSGALSAACHPRDPRIRHHEKKVHWGVEIDDDDATMLHEREGKMKRCTFTSLDAHYPDSEEFYA